MPPLSPESLPSPEQLREATQTLVGLPQPGEDLSRRLECVAALVAGAGPLPAAPVLLWREADNSVRHAVIGAELVVGRNTGQGGLTLGQDKTLSKRHFVIRNLANGCTLEDLQSRNGTAVNRPHQRIEWRVLRDGDLILAGDHTFAFLADGGLG